MGQDIIDFIVSAWHWLVDAAVSWLLQPLADLIAAIPVPDWYANASSFVDQIPDSVIYYSSVLHLGSGITIIFSAYTLRFLIRRLPFIG